MRNRTEVANGAGADVRLAFLAVVASRERRTVVGLVARS